jgi:hypothetical protein
MRGWLYDGEIALRHEVTITVSGDDLQLGLSDGRSFSVPRSRLFHAEERPDAEVYGRRDIEGWRLGVTEDDGGLAHLLPERQRYGRLIDRIGLGPALLIGLVASGLVLFLGSHAPEWLAPLVPRTWEKNFGDTLVGDFGNKACAGAGGQEALNELARRLSPRAGEFNIRVVNIRMVNAAALPGGNIVIFDGLLKEADGAEELAGVLAHEIAHVEERHTTQMMIRHFGLSTLIAGFGGTTGTSIETIMSASYSRSSEEKRTGRRSGHSAKPGFRRCPRPASSSGSHGRRKRSAPPRVGSPIFQRIPCPRTESADSGRAQRRDAPISHRSAASNGMLFTTSASTIRPGAPRALIGGSNHGLARWRLSCDRIQHD